MGSAGLGAFRRGEAPMTGTPYICTHRAAVRKMVANASICSPEMPYNSRLTTGNCPINVSLPDSSNH